VVPRLRRQDMYTYGRQYPMFDQALMILNPRHLIKLLVALRVVVLDF
jgi:hypothetical protein